MFNASPRLMTTDLKHDLQTLVLSQTRRDIQNKDVRPWHNIHPHISPFQIQLRPGTEYFGIVMPKYSCPDRYRASLLKWLEQTLGDSDEQGITLLFSDPVAMEV